MKPKHIIGAVIIAACLGAMFYFSKNFATPYVTFDEAAKAQGRQVQVMGEAGEERRRRAHPGIRSL